MYRRWDGRLSSGRRDVRVLLLSVPGRRTGVPRETCVRFLPVPEGYLVWGTWSGSRGDPDWFRNLRHAREVDVQVGAVRSRLRPRELLGEERDAAWRDTVLAQAPEVGRYAV